MTLDYIKAVDKNAGIKVDVNISVNEKIDGKRVEVKNINSIQDIKTAIDYEIKRQIKEGTVRETRRLLDDGTTKRMRSKEELADYRFITDPDLPGMIISDELINKIKSSLPESPEVKLHKLIKDYGIDKKSAEVLSSNLELVEFFESIITKTNPKLAVPWVTGELLRFLNWNDVSLDEVCIHPEHFIELLNCINNGKITELKAKKILDKFFPESFSVSKVLDSVKTINDEELITGISKNVIKENTKAVGDYKSGRTWALNFLIGKVMDATQRRADYKIVKDILEKLMKR